MLPEARNAFARGPVVNPYGSAIDRGAASANAELEPTTGDSVERDRLRSQHYGMSVDDLSDECPDTDA